MEPYERLVAWPSCHALTLAVYRATDRWPANERYLLVSQIRRAALSATCNLVEGAARPSRRQFRAFLDVSAGSLSEVGSLLRIAADLGYLPREAAVELEQLRRLAARRTWGLRRKLGQRPRPGSP